MQAIVLNKPGKPETLHLADIPRPEPAAGEALIRVYAVSLNPVDYQLAASGHPAWDYPFVLGLDVAGTIAALGPGVSGWRAGERVVYHGNLSSRRLR